MNCQSHPEIPATAYCRTCGKPVCEECRRDAYGTVFCAEHAPAPAAAAPPSPPPDAPRQPGRGGPGPGTYVYSDVSPGLAFFLGWIPGVGAIYNGQYAKGLVHAVIFGVLCSILDAHTHGMEPMFGILLCAWMFYMVFEAYHTAVKRRNGEPVDEYSSLLNLRSKHQVPVAGVVLICLGIALLLHTLDVIDFSRVLEYWPVLLILAGAYLLYNRFTGQDAAAKELGHERR
jgi:uncharacterized membrane protein YfcA